MCYLSIAIGIVCLVYTLFIDTLPGDSGPSVPAGFTGSWQEYAVSQRRKINLFQGLGIALTIIGIAGKILGF